MTFLGLFTSYFLEKSHSSSVSSPFHLSAHASPVLSLSFPLPSLLLLQRHLRSISVFSPSSMWLQPFSHPTSNQTHSAYWWSSNGLQVDSYLSSHEAPSLSPPPFNPPPPHLQPTMWHWHYGMFYITVCVKWLPWGFCIGGTSYKHPLHINWPLSVPSLLCCSVKVYIFLLQKKIKYIHNVCDFSVVTFQCYSI